ncbi:DUF1549 and DUF1553 domain-containing protein [Neorhodopirellula pilleata]|uniref:Cytochrome c domain-containing protein n=1 Tax=Neorhodopirellula pilleata TaxID=2714738 RepID=A0A5C6AH71_9BACT|nr:DUF1549 and DUF1553 domain-containing protein [Neorhodopirellula pilleata]TWT97513.1 hypothetical protein Pla100_26670 [Neorhodopirellula pilleata]
MMSLHRSIKTIGLAIAILGILFVASATSASAQSSRNKKAPPKPVTSKLPESVRDGKPAEIKVAKVRVPRVEIAASAAMLDGLVEQKLLSESITPGDLASDEKFLRRIYLDVAGRIPTLKEATEFLESKDDDRREKLIDQLLGSPDYVSNFYNFWADTLRLIDRPQPNIVVDPYNGYVKQCIAENKPYDKWVYEMLTADGKVWDNPATGYQLRDEGMPLPYVDNTVRIFLGTQIGCAQCHDHPFDVWTQHEFYKLAAFTAGTRTRIMRGDPGFEKGNPAQALIQKAREHFPNGRVPGEFQRLAQANTYMVREVKADLRLPHDYAYSDAKPKDKVEPAVLWGEIPSSASNSSPREQFAAWVTDASNPFFSKMIVNRIWQRLLGVGLVEPVDDFNEDNPCVNEPLMEFLQQEMVRRDFDLKEFTRMVLYSQTYQREAFDYDITDGEPYYFPGPTVRRMTAEQVWDSILTLAAPNPMPFQRPTAEDMRDIMDVDFGTMTFERMLQRVERFGDTYFSRGYQRELRQHAYKGIVLCRASELPSPLPGDHFLRQFGQGDREVINGSQSEATVPQILSMFNGAITHVMLEPGSALVDNVLKLNKPADQMDAIFVSILAREPKPADRVVAAKEFSQQQYDTVALGNIAWALLNTREFLFIQ